MAGQQRTSSHPTPRASTVDIAKQNVSCPLQCQRTIMLTGVGRDARTLLYRRHTSWRRQTPAAAARSLQDASLKPKEEDASQHQSCNVPQQQPLCGVRLWASSQHHHLLPRELTGVAVTTAATPPGPRPTPSHSPDAMADEAASANKWSDSSARG